MSASASNVSNRFGNFFQMPSVPILPHQVKFPPQPAVHADDGPVDIADQAVAQHDIWNFPVSSLANARKHLNSRNSGGFAAGLAP
jgi:hypothetical protein